MNIVTLCSDLDWLCFRVLLTESPEKESILGFEQLSWREGVGTWTLVSTCKYDFTHCSIIFGRHNEKLGLEGYWCEYGLDSAVVTLPEQYVIWAGPVRSCSRRAELV